MLGPKPTDTDSTEGVCISFEERQQALALRWQLDRLQVTPQDSSNLIQFEKTPL